MLHCRGTVFLWHIRSHTVDPHYSQVPYLRICLPADPQSVPEVLCSQVGVCRVVKRFSCSMRVSPWRSNKVTLCLLVSACKQGPLHVWSAMFSSCLWFRASDFAAWDAPNGRPEYCPAFLLGGRLPCALQGKCGCCVSFPQTRVVLLALGSTLTNQ